jgi:hypothetical protein
LSRNSGNTHQVHSKNILNADKGSIQCEGYNRAGESADFVFYRSIGSGKKKLLYLAFRVPYLVLLVAVQQMLVSAVVLYICSAYFLAYGS